MRLAGRSAFRRRFKPPMPILTQPTSASQRRRPWLWVLLGVPGGVLALLVGLVAWSFYQPVTFRFGSHQAGLGCGMKGADAFSASLAPESKPRPGLQSHLIDLPAFLGGDTYIIWWY
jgi:hypothetical protein